METLELKRSPSPSAVTSAARRMGMAPGLVVYLQEVRRERPFSPEEEMHLANRYRRGDMTAREKLVRANLRLVVAIAWHYLGRGLEMMDLVEAGNRGLLKAIDSFKPSKGIALRCRAFDYIHVALREAVAAAPSRIGGF
jgi:RNA polymerase primary sigma factor